MIRCQYQYRYKPLIKLNKIKTHSLFMLSFIDYSSVLDLELRFYGELQPINIYHILKPTKHYKQTDAIK